ncbi:hypothetical protein D3878_02500 [Noviherbaspirillum sedimenti]|uniref:Uncharacterized protein n=2 Tax=Noviherbaspirillum sedimenti TaxID=2320865 RepID=A0A3A3FZ04_9BURK|nr:hypothetical protein D3878_02500 [Noviherbaspirillum sedimenti]
MLNLSAFPIPSPSALPTSAPVAEALLLADDDGTVEWEEEEIVLLHWRLLKAVAELGDPATPLEDKLDMLRWVFTEREKESRPFSFANCIQVVACSPLSPLPYIGQVDADAVKEAIRGQLQAWLQATLNRYPAWVREAVQRHPEWIARHLEKNPQWLNQQVRQRFTQGDLFA